jgi:hypothetical protein
MGEFGLRIRRRRQQLFALAALAVMGTPRASHAQTPEPAVAPAPAAPAATPPASSCVPDCRSGFVCLEGTCVSACNPPCAAHEQCTGAGECLASSPAPLTAPATSLDRESEAAGAHSNFNAHVNALGVFQFGLVPAVEFGGRNFGIAARLRLMTTGILSHTVAADTSDDEEFASGIGIGAGARYYSGSGGNMRGFYVGGGVEYVSTRVEDTTDDREAYLTKAIIPEFDIGYRWAFGRFLLGLGGMAGYLLVQSATTEDLSNGQDDVLYSNTAEDTFYAMAVLDLGFFF